MTPNYPLRMSWQELWQHILTLPVDTQRQMAVAIDQEISSWIPTAPVGVVTEVLSSAPDCVITSMTKRRLLRRDAIRALNASRNKPTKTTHKSSCGRKAAYLRGGV